MKKICFREQLSSEVSNLKNHEYPSNLFPVAILNTKKQNASFLLHSKVVRSLHLINPWNNHERMV